MGILEIVQLVIGLLFIASLVAIAVQKLRMPYTVGLVLVGLGLAFTRIELFPEAAEALDVGSLLFPNLILTILVPPLIFEAAFHIKFSELRQSLSGILAFAIPGVLLTMLMVGGFVSWRTALPFETALVFGALIAATDPVAVVALFRTMGVPKQLLVMLEGESLFNDGTAIVVFNLMLAIVVDNQTFNGVDFLGKFVLVAGGGIVVGLLVSVFLSAVIRFINNHLIEVTLTTVGAYASYLVAEHFHVSGVLAVVVAGLVIGNIGERGMSPTTRISLFNVWEFASYLANSFAFLLIGLVIDLPKLLSSWRAILIAIVAVLVARAVVIYSISQRISSVTNKMQHVLYWGGLRGAISLALALSLPSELGGETQLLLQDMTFGVVLFTLLIQGTTMRTVVNRLGLSERSEIQVEYQRHQARTFALKTGIERVDELHDEGLISEHTWQIIKPALQRQIQQRSEVVHEILHSNRALELSEINNTFEEILRTQRSSYASLLNSGSISEEIFTELVNEIDFAMMNQELNIGELMLRRTPDMPPITKMIFATINQTDLQATMNLLGLMSVPTASLVTEQTNDGKQLITLVMGIEDGQLDEVVEAIGKCCAEPPVFRRGLFSLFQRQPEKAEEVLDNQIYVFDIEHFEEI
jgi:CPA1 family monovalent cation:H+ antiporter